MSRCTICTSRNRIGIEMALQVGESLRAIAERFDVSKDSTARHRNHICTASPAAAVYPRALESAADAALVEPATAKLSKPDASPKEADEILEETEKIRLKGWDLVDKAERVGELRTSVGALREVRGVTELKARLTGRLNESPTVLQIAVFQPCSNRVDPQVIDIDIEATR